jgi:hypothetical protein
MALLERVASLLSVDPTQASARARKKLVLDIENQLMQLKTQAASAIAALRRLESESPRSRRLAAARREVEVVTGALTRLEAKRLAVQARRTKRVDAGPAPEKNKALEQMLRTLKAERKAN